MNYTEEYAIRELCNAVIIQAVEDWRFLCELLKKPKHYMLVKDRLPYTFESLQEFFRSEWCLALIGKECPLRLLGALEQERQAVLKN